MKIDLRTTGYDQIDIPENLEEEINEAFINGKILCANELLSWLNSKGYQPTITPMKDRSHFMSIKDNGGSETIEVFDDDGNEIWDNVNYKYTVIKTCPISGSKTVYYFKTADGAIETVNKLIKGSEEIIFKQNY